MCERPRVGGLMACACVAPVLKSSTCKEKDETTKQKSSLESFLPATLFYLFFISFFFLSPTPILTI
jgi:hypothetical protein